MGIAWLPQTLSRDVNVKGKGLTLKLCILIHSVADTKQAPSQLGDSVSRQQKTHEILH